MARGFLGLPREKGAYGIWLSGSVYGVLVGFTWLSVVALAGAAAALALVDYARYGRGLRRVAAMALPSAPLAYVAYATLPQSVPLVAVMIVMLYLALGGGLRSIVYGAGVLGGIGGFIALAGGAGVLESLLPASYLLAATGAAGVKVVSVKAETVSALATGYIGAFAVTAALALQGSPAPLALVGLDALWRAAGWLSGLERGMSVKRYGLYETARTLIVMALIGASL